VQGGLPVGICDVNACTSMHQRGCCLVTGVVDGVVECGVQTLCTGIREITQKRQSDGESPEMLRNAVGRTSSRLSMLHLNSNSKVTTSKKFARQAQWSGVRPVYTQSAENRNAAPVQFSSKTKASISDDRAWRARLTWTERYNRSMSCEDQSESLLHLARLRQHHF
jgi:hypothetical protein